MINDNEGNKGRKNRRVVKKERKTFTGGGNKEMEEQGKGNYKGRERKRRIRGEENDNQRNKWKELSKMKIGRKTFTAGVN